MVKLRICAQGHVTHFINHSVDLAGFHEGDPAECSMLCSAHTPYSTMGSGWQIFYHQINCFPLTKNEGEETQRLAYWVMDVIAMAYKHTKCANPSVSCHYPHGHYLLLITYYSLLFCAATRASQCPFCRCSKIPVARVW